MFGTLTRRQPASGRRVQGSARGTRDPPVALPSRIAFDGAVDGGLCHAEKLAELGGAGLSVVMEPDRTLRALVGRAQRTAPAGGEAVREGEVKGAGGEGEPDEQRHGQDDQGQAQVLHEGDHARVGAQVLGGADDRCGTAGNHAQRCGGLVLSSPAREHLLAMSALAAEENDPSRRVVEATGFISRAVRLRHTNDRRARQSPGPPSISLRLRLRVSELALGGLQHAGAALVRALVGADLLGAIVVSSGQDRGDLGGGELVVSRPRLVAAQ
jgi:hypothetical protein